MAALLRYFPKGHVTLDSTLLQVLVSTFGSLSVLGLLAVIGMYYRQQGLRGEVTEFKKKQETDLETVHKRITRKDDHYDRRLSELDKEWEGRFSGVGVMQTDILERLARIETQLDLLLGDGKPRKGRKQP